MELHRPPRIHAAALLLGWLAFGCTDLKGDVSGDDGADAGRDAAVADAGPGDGDGDTGDGDGDGDTGDGDGDTGDGDGDTGDGDGDTGDGDGGTADNRPPVIDSLTLDVDGLGVSLQVQASDPDGNLESVSVDWGDGASSQANSGFDAIALDHAYDGVASYTVTVTAIDASNASVQEERGVTTSIPRSGLLLELLFDGDATDTGPDAVAAMVDRGTYAVDRFNMGFSAVDLYNGNETGSEGLVSTPYIDFSESFTLSIWLAAQPSGNRYRMIGQGQWVNLFFDRDSVQLGIQAGLFPDSTKYLLTAAGVHESSDLFVPDVWISYVATVERKGDVSSVRIYKDGAVVASDDAAPLFINPGVLDAVDACRFYVGHEPTSDCDGTRAAEFGALRAWVDDVRLYNRALSEAEVMALYRERDWPDCCND